MSEGSLDDVREPPIDRRLELDSMEMGLNGGVLPISALGDKEFGGRPWKDSSFRDARSPISCGLFSLGLFMEGRGGGAIPRSGKVGRAKDAKVLNVSVNLSPSAGVGSSSRSSKVSIPEPLTILLEARCCCTSALPVEGAVEGAMNVSDTCCCDGVAGGEVEAPDKRLGKCSPC